MPYKIEELTFRDGSAQEQQRTRKIFEDLKEKATKGQALSQHEIEFFCTCVRGSALPEDGIIEDYDCCDNYKFKFLYPIYFNDLTGGERHYKPLNGQIVEVSVSEAQENVKYLVEKAKEWDTITQNGKHREELLKQAAKEARDDLKLLDATPEFQNDPYAKGKFRYLYRRWGHLLQSKYVYHTCQEILEAASVSPIELTLVGQKIELNEFSLIHILNRHYAQSTKRYATGKSFHNENFDFRNLAVILQEIFDKINTSTIASSVNHSKLVFRYHRDIYEAYSRVRKKQIKGVKGDIDFTRLETLYPLEDEDKLLALSNDYSEHPICSNLSVFLPR